MTRRSLAWIVGLAIVTGLLWIGIDRTFDARDRGPTSTPREALAELGPTDPEGGAGTATPAPEPGIASSRTATEPGASTVSPDTSGPGSAGPGTSGVADAAAAEMLLRYFRDQSGPFEVERLMDQGIARSDAEATIDRTFAQLAHCYVDALNGLSDEQGVDHDEVFYALQTTLFEGDGPLITEFFRPDALAAATAPCAYSAAQTAGLVLP